MIQYVVTVLYPSGETQSFHANGEQELGRIVSTIYTTEILHRRPFDPPFIKSVVVMTLKQARVEYLKEQERMERERPPVRWTAVVGHFE